MALPKFIRSSILYPKITWRRARAKLKSQLKVCLLSASRQTSLEMFSKVLTSKRKQLSQMKSISHHREMRELILKPLTTSLRE